MVDLINKFFLRRFEGDFLLGLKLGKQKHILCAFCVFGIVVMILIYIIKLFGLPGTLRLVGIT